MRAKLTYAVPAAVLVFYFVLVGSRGVLLIAARHPAHRRLRRGRPGPAADRRLVPLADHPVRPHAEPAGRELEAEGGLPVDELVPTPAAGSTATRPTRCSPGARRRPRTAPDDWRSWFRLAVAYHDARDTPRARKAMQRAIALHDGQAGHAPEPRRTGRVRPRRRRRGPPDGQRRGRYSSAQPSIGVRGHGRSLGPGQEVRVVVGDQRPQRLAAAPHHDQRLPLDRARAAPATSPAAAPCAPTRPGATAGSSCGRSPPGARPARSPTRRPAAAAARSDHQQRRRAAAPRRRRAAPANAMISAASST